jgi:hypothetical protein
MFEETGYAVAHMEPLTQPAWVDRYVIARRPGKLVTKSVSIAFRDRDDLEDLYAFQYVVDARAATATHEGGNAAPPPCRRGKSDRMRRRSSRRRRATALAPVGSGRRYKECHGAISGPRETTAGDAAIDLSCAWP